MYVPDQNDAAPAGLIIDRNPNPKNNASEASPNQFIFFLNPKKSTIFSTLNLYYGITKS